eukprot:423866-Pelagomonas_calceolata.AAC.1
MPDWVFPTGNGSAARHKSRPDAAFVRRGVLSQIEQLTSALNRYLLGGSQRVVLSLMHVAERQA